VLLQLLVTKSAESSKWSGFAPTAHTLNDQIIWQLTMTRQEPGDGPQKSTDITLAGAFSDTRDQPIISIDDDFGTLKVKTATSEFWYGGPSFNVSLLAAILSLHKDGFESYGSRWFYYDSDFVTDDPHKSYSFFIVSGQKLARESVTFSDYHGNGFNPQVFVPPDYKSPIWWNEHHWEEAWIRQWYRRFYQETKTGQLMVLRPDEPALYYFPEGRWQQAVAFYQVGEHLSRIHRLLVWVLVALVVIILLLWK
jgi:hypothetical protein